MTRLITIPKQVYSTSETAHYLGVCKSDIDKSRVTGELRGHPAPSFIKLGRSIRYRVEDLNKWLKERPSFSSIAEESAAQMQ